MNVLLTGGTGFVGSYVARRLLQRGHTVAITIRPGSDDWRINDIANNLEYVVTPSAGADASVAWVEKTKPEALVHLAWSGVGNAHRNALEQFDNIADGARLVEAAGNARTGIVIGLGSQAEYGPTDDGPIRESTPTRPTTFYGAAKLAGSFAYEQIAARTGARFAWLRLFSSYGPRDDGAWMIPYLIAALLRGERPALTLGEQLWDYVFVEDAAAAVVRVLESPAGTGIFNLGSGYAVTLRTIIEAVRDAIDPSLALGFGEVPYRADQVMHLQADVTRLNALGWFAQTPLDKGIRATVAWSVARQAQAKAGT